MKRVITTVFAAILGILPYGLASAHVTANPDEAHADSYFRTALRVSHGCDGWPTLRVRVKVPEGVYTIRPQPKAGWRVTIKKRKLDKPVDIGHGRTATTIVDEIIWTGSLPDAHFEEFGLSMKLPATPHQMLYFPVVQECQKGAHRWIDIPAKGQKWEDLNEPAPFVRLLDPKPAH
jgi:periplasmic copper chaperone A